MTTRKLKVITYGGILIGTLAFWGVVAYALYLYFR